MSALAITTWILGLLAIASGIWSLLNPAQVRAGLEKYPRSIWPGRILMAIDMVFAAYAVTTLHLGGFDAWKGHLYWVTPLCIYLGIRYLDEMLSVRALGGLLLLIAGPILAVARWHESPWRLVITTLAYLWIIAGLVFLLSPWWFRRIVMHFKTDGSIRAAGLLKAVVGVALILLAIAAY